MRHKRDWKGTPTEVIVGINCHLVLKLAEWRGLEVPE